MDLAPLRLEPNGYGAFFLECGRNAPLLVCDYDGTLAPFTRKRDEAVLKPSTQRLLASLCDTGTRLVILSGRQSEEVGALLSLPVEIWGCHGMERLLSDGRFNKMEVPADAAARLRKVRSFFDGFPESAIESKPSGVAVHWREEPEVLRQYEKISEEVAEYARASELRILPFNGGVEYLPSYFSKGTALKKICDSYAESSPICYMGDDITDEDAFSEIRKIDGARGILVSDEFRESFADARIHSSERDTFLEFWLDKIAGRGVRKS